MQRNITLLERECEEKPQDVRLAGQLVWEYLAAEEFDQAEQLCGRMLEFCKEEFEDVMVQFLALADCRASIAKEDWEAAVVKVDTLLQRTDFLEVPKAELLISTAKIKGKVGNYTDVLKAVEEFLECKESIKNMGAQAELQEIFDFKRFLTDEYERTMLACGLRAVIEIEQYDKAKELLDQIDWTDTENKPFEQMLLLTELYGKSGRKDLFFPYAEQIARNPKMQKQFQVALEELRRKYPHRMLSAEEKELLKVFSEALITAKHLQPQNDMLIQLLAGMQEVLSELKKRAKQLPGLEECDRLLLSCLQTEEKEQLVTQLQAIETILLKWHFP